MTNAAYSAHPALAIVADGALPVIAAAAFVLPGLASRKGRLPHPQLFWICALTSIALLYAMRLVGHKTTLWTAHGVIFSAHTALGISLVVTLAAFRLWLLPLFAIALAGYLWLIVYLGYHHWGDIYSTAAVILPLSLLCHLPWWRKTAKAN